MKTAAVFQNALLEVWQANSSGRYRHSRRQPPRASRSEFSGSRPRDHRRRRQLPLRLDQAWRVSLAQSSECLEARPHSLLAVRGGPAQPPGDSNVFPRRSLDGYRSGSALDRGRGRAAAAGVVFRSVSYRARMGHWATASTSYCAAARPRPLKKAANDVDSERFPNRRAILQFWLDDKSCARHHGARWRGRRAHHIGIPRHRRRRPAHSRRFHDRAVASGLAGTLPAPVDPRSAMPTKTSVDSAAWRLMQPASASSRL